MFGTEKRIDELIENYYCLVPKIASKYKFIKIKDPDFYQDILQEGTLGLIESIHRFDQKKGVFFYFYAQKNIKNSINSFLRRTSTLVHIPTNILYESFKLKRFIQNNAPTRQQMLEYMGCSEDKLEKLINISNISFCPVEDRDMFCNKDIVQKIDNEIKKDFILNIILNFSPEVQTIFNKRFCENRSWRKIGEDLGISHEKARCLFNDHIELIKKEVKQHFC